jgi:(p)ppGpp synthase/HD superfamily hydrolase
MKTRKVNHGTAFDQTQYTPSRLERAVVHAYDSHFGQFDEQGKSYFLHVMAVVLGVESESEQIVAALHDVIEDCGDTIEDIESACGELLPEEIEALYAITRREGEPYLEVYIPRVKANEIARKVKLADIAHNTDPRRALNSKTLAKRYTKAKAILEAA